MKDPEQEDFSQKFNIPRKGGKCEVAKYLLYFKNTIFNSPQLPLWPA